MTRLVLAQAAAAAGTGASPHGRARARAREPAQYVSRRHRKAPRAPELPPPSSSHVHRRGAWPRCPTVGRLASMRRWASRRGRRACRGRGIVGELRQQVQENRRARRAARAALGRARARARPTLRHLLLRQRQTLLRPWNLRRLTPAAAAQARRHASVDVRRCRQRRPGRASMRYPRATHR